MKRDEKRDTRNESPIPELAGEGVAVACDPAPGEARRAALLIAHDVGYMGDPDLKDLSEEAEEIGRMLGGLRRSLLRQR